MTSLSRRKHLQQQDNGDSPGGLETKWLETKEELQENTAREFLTAPLGKRDGPVRFGGKREGHNYNACRALLRDLPEGKITAAAAGTGTPTESGNEALH